MIPSTKNQVKGLIAKYAVLEYGDIILESDEYYNPFDDEWKKAEKDTIGDEYNSDYYKPMRRKFS